ncbi:MAG: type IV pilus modification protein PilV [Halofilum sp. (in: g-proteobacteria)]|nr:type IV pilus modification protein PilV [Halofilum sp. (in: g-proteobacteria)]
MMRRNRGFTFVELLMAVLVLGIGLVGVAGLQSVALGMNYGSYLRSQATVLAGDMADRMRANPVGVGNGGYDMGAAATATETTDCDTTTGCSTGDMAEHDLYLWIQRVQAVLPSANAVVCIDSTPMDGTPGTPACDGTGANHAVKIWWLEKEDGGNQRRFITEFRP